MPASEAGRDGGRRGIPVPPYSGNIHLGPCRTAGRVFLRLPASVFAERGMLPLGTGAVGVLVAALGFVSLSPASAGVLAPALRALVEHGVPSGAAGQRPLSPFAPRIDAAGRVEVVIRPLRPQAPLPAKNTLVALGARRVRVVRLMDVIQAWVPVKALTAVASLPGVGYVGIPRYAVVKASPTHTPPAVRTTTPDRGALAPGGLGMLFVFSLFAAVHRRKSHGVLPRPTITCTQFLSTV
jgi:hypothetical protein